MTSRYDEEFGIMGQSPTVAPSAFDDFWATMSDMSQVLGQDEERHEFYHQIEISLLLDSPIGSVADVQEKFNMPTDRTTGRPLLDRNGAPVVPNETSKWGRFYAVLDTLGVPWEHKPSRLIGLHAHFQRKGTRLTKDDITAGKSTPRGELPYGRYVVEWDGYDNALRQSRGLSPILLTPTPPVATTSTVSDDSAQVPANDSDPDIAAALLADGKDFMRFLGAVRTTHQSLKAYGSKGALDRLVDDGLLKKSVVDGKEVYQLGPKFA